MEKTKEEKENKAGDLQQLRVACIGAGNRMKTYAKYLASHPEEVQVVAIVDPDPIRCCQLAEQFSVTSVAQFNSYNDFFQSGIDADVAIVCTPDNEHFRPTMSAIKLGMNVLLEKPIAQNIEECILLQQEARRQNVKVGICYPMHYHPCYLKLKQIADSKELGDLVSITLLNQVGTDRATHSYVRGIFNNSNSSTPLLLAKCSHDVDFLLWISGSECRQVSNYGSLQYFREDNAPKGSAERCIDCSVEEKCPFSAVNLYWRRREWIRNFNVENGQTIEDSIQRQLKEGPFGRCVFHCDNNILDHQALIMQMANGITLTLTIDCFTLKDNRKFFIHMTHGDIYCNEEKIVIQKFLTREKEVLDLSSLVDMPEHAGSDLLIVQEFFKALRGEEHSFTSFLDESIESHRVCWEAEENRLKNHSLSE